MAPNSGHTTYTTACHLQGESDLYGPGVRVSYYLFFFATLIAILQRTLSSTPHLKTGPIGRAAAAINIVTFALLIVLIRNTMAGSFAVLEWFLTYPTILVTFISLCFALPMLDNAGILLCYAFTLSLLTVCQPFLYWKYLNQGRREGLLFFSGIVTMAMTENTIQLNDIDLSDTPLGSTSQLIPFLTGLLSFLSTLYSCIPFLKILSWCLGRKLGLREKGSRERLLPHTPNSGSGTEVHETGYFEGSPHNRSQRRVNGHWGV
ncbi:hypothetical protein B0T16DRAFT_387788 [Cercophora newfieldiana]|uniref:Uncharacterized protein n=1 Tax=Cercophora newfieldiana TaxID=92897 RepID=A0AA39YHS5_9PEZI|nr:hypothetical protein B0T16DRAFT_387788 [Cercophora newfieldiana]